MSETPEADTSPLSPAPGGPILDHTGLSPAEIAAAPAEPAVSASAAVPTDPSVAADPAGAGTDPLPGAPGATEAAPRPEAATAAVPAEARAPAPGQSPDGAGSPPATGLEGQPIATPADGEPAEAVAGQASGQAPAEPVVGPVPAQTLPAEHSSSDPDTVPLDHASLPGHLEPGTVLAGRFSILRSLTAAEATEMLGGLPAEEGAAFFAVDDHEGFAHCWSCGSTQNDPRQRFCVDCGAPRQQEWVLAQTSTSAGLTDEVAESGFYYHLLHRRKQFGSSGMALEVAAFSAEGPHIPNEDSTWTVAVSGCYNSRAQSLGAAVLADGMGGYAPGSGLISKLIVETVGRGIFGLLSSEPEAEPDESGLRALMQGAIAAANGKVLEEVNRHGDMGATLVAALIYGPTAFVANIGDSRAYYISPSGAVTQITRDQSLIEQQVALGLLPPDAAFTAQGNNVILHAVGEPGVEEAFDWYTQPLEPGSYLLLCSDGYWKTMQHDIWGGQGLAGQVSLHALAWSLVQRALERNTDDNTTVILVGVN